MSGGLTRIAVLKSSAASEAGGYCVWLEQDGPGVVLLTLNEPRCSTNCGHFYLNVTWQYSVSDCVECLKHSHDILHEWLENVHYSCSLMKKWGWLADDRRRTCHDVIRRTARRRGAHMYIAAARQGNCVTAHDVLITTWPLVSTTCAAAADRLAPSQMTRSVVNICCSRSFITFHSRTYARGEIGVRDVIQMDLQRCSLWDFPGHYPCDYFQLQCKHVLR